MLRYAAIWTRFAAFRIDSVPFCCVMQRFGAFLLPSAMIWTHFAALCNDLVSSCYCSDLVPFCCVVHRYDLVPFCYVLRRVGAFLLPPAVIWRRFAASCTDLRSFCYIPHQFGAQALENEFILLGTNSFFPGELIHSLENSFSRE